MFCNLLLLTSIYFFPALSQVILSTISSVILLFARSVGLAAVEASNPAAGMRTQASASFFIGGVGIAISFASIFWTWGGARLSNRLIRGKTNRIQSANLLRRAITVATALNLSGMLITLVGTFVIIGGLATKVLTAGGLSPFGAVAAGGVAGGGAISLQTVQPLDILIVQVSRCKEGCEILITAPCNESTEKENRPFHESAGTMPQLTTYETFPLPFPSPPTPGQRQYATVALC